MLLTSPGDKHSARSMALSQTQAPDALPEGQGGSEDGQSRVTVSTASVLDDDRADLAASHDDGDLDAHLTVDNTTRADVSVQSSRRQDSPLKAAPPSETALDGLYALQQAATLNANRKEPTASQKLLAKLPAIHTTDFAALESSESAEVDSYAAPLSPLRTRDLQALSDLFQRDDMGAIAADISHRLLSLLPEPYWDDDTFAFLQEFL